MKKLGKNAKIGNISDALEASQEYIGMVAFEEQAELLLLIEKAQKDLKLIENIIEKAEK